MYLEWIDIDTAGNKFRRYACRSHCLTLLVHLFMLYCVDSFLPCSLDPIWTPEPRPLIYIILFEARNESIGDDMATNGYQWSIKISTNCSTPFRQYLCTQSIFDWPTSLITPNTPMGDSATQMQSFPPATSWSSLPPNQLRYFCVCPLWISGKISLYLILS